GRVAPVHVIEVDRLDAEALKGSVARRGDPGRRILDPPLAAAGDEAELGGDQRPAAARAAQELADEALVLAAAIRVGGVEQLDAGIERRSQRGEGFVAVRGPVGMRHARAAVAEHGDVAAGSAEGNFLHRLSAEEGGAPRRSALKLSALDRIKDWPR